MVTVAHVRKIALTLQGVTEQDHHGFPSFRVGDGRILCTLPDSGHLNVMLDPLQVDSVLAAAPQACEPLLWGKALRGVSVALARADRKLVSALLADAWARKAPAKKKPSR